MTGWISRLNESFAHSFTPRYAYPGNGKPQISHYHTGKAQMELRIRQHAEKSRLTAQFTSRCNDNIACLSIQPIT